MRNSSIYVFYKGTKRDRKNIFYSNFLKVFTIFNKIDNLLLYLMRIH